MNTPYIQERLIGSRRSWLKRTKITSVQLIYLEGALVVFLAIGTLTWPLGGDQAFFYFVGDTILRGGIPYRDAWELKGPLTYYITATILAAFGHREISIRIFDLLAIMLFFGFLKRMVPRFEGTSNLGAIFTIVFFGLAYTCLGFWFTAQPDEWGGMLIAVCVALLLKPSWSTRWTMLVIGVLIALSALIKPTFLIFLPLPLLYPPCNKIGWTRGLALCSVCVLACVTTITLALVIIFRHGGFGDYLDLLHFLSTSYFPFSQRHLLDEVLLLLPQLMWNSGVAIPYALVPVGIWLIWHKGYRRPAQILSTWFLLAILLVLAQGTYWPYTFIPATISAAVILGNLVSLADLATTALGMRKLVAGLAALVIGLSVLIPSDLSTVLFRTLAWPSYMLGAVKKADYLLRVTQDSPDDWDRVSSYIDSRSNENDTIFLWTWDIRLIAKVKRRSATRFGTFEALISEGPLQAKYRQIFISEISRHPPRYIVVDSLESMYRSESSLWLLRNFEEFNRFLHDYYKLETHIGGHEIWAHI